MRDRPTTFFILVPGPWQSKAAVESILTQEGIPVMTGPRRPDIRGKVFTEVVFEAGGFADGFLWGNQGPLSDLLVAKVQSTTTAALVEIGLTLEEGAPTAIRVGRALRAAGGVAVRMEASGAASDWDSWLSRLEQGDPRSLLTASVLIVNDGEGTFFTCGMHQFELPDVEILASEPDVACSWLMDFCTYSVAECPLLLTGHTFRPDAETPRRRIERWPDWRHHPADGRHNPWGLWRALRPKERGLAPQALTLMPVPALVAVLMSKESSLGRALTRSELEGIVESAHTIALEPADVHRLERSRGYVDIEPRLAWQQWQLIRGSLVHD
jgi:hypothetical protein